MSVTTVTRPQMSVFCANKSDLEYWHFVGDLGLQLHLLGVVELEEEVGGKAAVEA